jgi:hypothetical protein
MSALGVKQTSLVRDRVSVNDPRVDLEETGTVILIRPSLLRIIVSLLLAMGQKPTFCRQITDVCYVPGTDVAQFQSLCLTGQPPAMAAEGVASPFPAH